jgi:RNA polymerase sigma-70 factor (ECF subfamily)
MVLRAFAEEGESPVNPASGESDGSSSRASNLTSLTLLERVRSHDEDAWERLVSLYGPLVYDWCRYQGLQAADAADVVQEVFGTVSKRIAEFRRNRPGDSFRGWLWSVTRSRIYDYFRSRRAQLDAVGGTDAMRRWEQIPDEEPAIYTNPASQMSADSPVSRALGLIRPEFRDRTWQAFWRAAVAGEKTADIAADLGISLNAVRKAKSRVLRRLREEFGNLLD